jgi:hypothetical protein
MASAASAAAVAAELFKLGELPAGVLSKLSALLPRDQAARACCVSKSWNAALSDPHLWKELTFDGMTLRTNNTFEAAVRGAMAKAGGALRSMASLPAATLVAALRGSQSLVPDANWALARAALNFAHVEGDCDVSQALQVLHACPTLPELCVDLLCVKYEDFRWSAAAEILTHPALRVTGMDIDFAAVPRTDYEDDEPYHDPFVWGAAESAEAMRTIVRCLHNSSQRLSYMNVVYGTNMEAADVQAFHVALAATQVKKLELKRCRNDALYSLAVAQLPVSLQTLNLSECADWEDSLDLQEFLVAAKKTQLQELWVESENPNWDDGTITAVAMLLEGNTLLRKLTLLNYWLPSVRAIADVLQLSHNSGLQELFVAELHDAGAVHALARVLSVDGSMRSVTIICANDWGVHDYPQQDDEEDRADQVAGAMNALAAALTTNTTLARLRLGVRLTDPDDYMYSHVAVRAADAALRGVPRVGQSLLLNISFFGGSQPGLQNYTFW